MKRYSIIVGVLICFGIIAKLYPFALGLMPRNVTREADCSLSRADDNFFSCVYFSYYEIVGQNRQEILAEVRQKGPNGYYAYTDTAVMVEEFAAQNCRVSVRSQIRMPQLERGEHLPSAFVVQWERMIDALEEHELQHHEIGTKIAWTELMNGCTGVDSLQERLDAANRAYDSATNHGRTEGVVF